MTSRREFLKRSAYPIVLATSDALAAAVKPPPVKPLRKPDPSIDRRPLSTVAGNTARNLGPYANLDPQFFAGPLSAFGITDYSSICIDAIGNRMCLFGGGHGPSQETDIRIFDLESLEWSSLYPSTPVSQMTVANLDVDKGRYISTNHPTARHSYNLALVRDRRFHLLQPRGMPDAVNLPAMAGAKGGDNGSWGGRTCAYDFEANQWSYGKAGSAYASPPNVPWYFASAAALDPQSRRILVVGPGPFSGPGGVWVYDADDDSILLCCNCDVGGSPDIVYFPPNDRFYVLQSDGRVWEIIFNREHPTVSSVAALNVTGNRPTSANGIVCGYAYDPANKIIGGNVSNGVFYAFDPTTSVWTATMIRVDEGSSGIPNMTFHCLDFDPNSGCFVFLHNPLWGQPGTPSTWVFRFDRATATPAPPPVLAGGISLQSALDAGGTVTLGPGTLIAGGIVTKAGTRVVGNKTVLAGGAEAAGKGILVVEVDASIAGITFQNATVGDGNGAGIRHDAGSLAVSSCTFVRCQDGYLGNANVAFDHCTFDTCGAGDGQTHAVYVANGPSLASADACTFRGTKIGHHFKSRATKSVLTNCTMEAATESYSADFPFGGVVQIANCTMTQGPNTDNAVMINYATEGQPFQDNSFTMSNTTLTSSGVPNAVGIRIDPKLAAIAVTLTDVHFVGVPTPVQGATNVVYVRCTKDGAPL